MPNDNRRINGPENTLSYRLFSNSNPHSNVQKKIKDIFKNNTRPSERNFSEQRKIFLKCGVVSQAKGSAYFEVDNTKVIVSVYDPREIPKKTDYSLKGELYCVFKFAPFSCPTRRGYQQDAEEKQNSAILKRALESAVCRHKFPNFQVDVYVLVLENDGSALSAAITAAGVALAQAGIPMYDTITAATLGVQGSHKIVDPNLEEETLCNVAVYKNEGEKKYESHGIIILSMLSTHEQVSELYQTGNLSLDTINAAINILSKATKEIVPLVEKCLVNHVTKNLKTDVED
ncbi:hypothetical protein RN001_001188 [Aquatica leii]|uniref:Exoribonuclease phosphorolytic domain-containing protein n=1 Tax=Aquatica leii TaxID=1421715 RepID=A0AAN7Q7Q0_9COLE|nr:hypothetical protein RN001_001188 [Aquatica leii]